MGALWGTPLWKLSPFIQVMVAQTQDTYLRDVSQQVAGV